MKYDINDKFQQEKMLGHCPTRLWDSIPHQRLYLRAVEDYARYYTLCMQANQIDEGEASHAHNVLRKLSHQMYGEARGIVAALEVMTGNADALEQRFPNGEVWQGVTEDGHELYVDQWQWGTFKAKR